jgi:hypothetical protein
VRTVDIDGRRITYATDAEMAAAIAVMNCGSTHFQNVVKTSILLLGNESLRRAASATVAPCL